MDLHAMIPHLTIRLWDINRMASGAASRDFIVKYFDQTADGVFRNVEEHEIFPEINLAGAMQGAIYPLTAAAALGVAAEHLVPAGLLANLADDIAALDDYVSLWSDPTLVRVPDGYRQLFVSVSTEGRPAELYYTGFWSVAGQGDVYQGFLFGHKARKVYGVKPKNLYGCCFCDYEGFGGTNRMYKHQTSATVGHVRESTMAAKLFGGENEQRHYLHMPHGWQAQAVAAPTPAATTQPAAPLTITEFVGAYDDMVLDLPEPMEEGEFEAWRASLWGDGKQHQPATDDINNDEQQQVMTAQPLPNHYHQHSDAAFCFMPTEYESEDDEAGSMMQM